MNLNKLRKLANKAIEASEGCSSHSREDFLQITSKKEAKFYVEASPHAIIKILDYIDWLELPLAQRFKQDE